MGCDFYRSILAGFALRMGSHTNVEKVSHPGTTRDCYSRCPALPDAEPARTRLDDYSKTVGGCT